MTGRRPTAALISGLILAVLGLIAYPAPSAHGADIRNLEARLTNLEQQVGDLESDRVGYEISAAQVELMNAQAEQKYQRVEARLKALQPNQEQFQAKADPAATVKAGQTVRQKTTLLNAARTELEGILTESQVKIGRICDYASRLGESRPPSPTRLTEMKAEAESLHGQVKASLEPREAPFQNRIVDLRSLVKGLQERVRACQDLVDNRESFLDYYREVAKLHQEVKDAEANLDEALRIITQEMATRPFNTARNEIISELDAIKADLAGLADRPPELAGRLNELSARMNRLILPAAPPATKWLYKMAKLSGLTLQVDLAAGEALLAQNESAAASGRQAATEAEQALASAQAVGRRVGGELAKARECLAMLWEAALGPTPGSGSGPDLDGLAQRVDGLERDLARLIKLNDEKVRAYQEIEIVLDKLSDFGRTARDRARESLDAQDVFQEQISGLDKLVNRLESEVAGLETAQRGLIRATREVSRVKGVVCGFAQRSSASPPPGASEIKNWRTRSAELIVQAGLAQKIALERVDQRRLGALERPRLRAEANQLKSARESLLVRSLGLADLKTRLSDLAGEVDRVRELKRRVDDRTAPLDQLPLLGAKLGAIRASARSIYLGDGDSALKDRARALIDRVAALQSKITALPRPGSIILPEPGEISSESAPLDEAARKLSLQAQTMEDLTARAGTVLTAIAAAEAVDLSAADNSAQVLAEAETCLHSIDRALGAARNTGRQAESAINDCDLARAKNLISQMPPGPARDAVKAKYDRASALERELRKLVAKARAQYKDCRLNKATATLQTALGRAQCQKHRASIDKKLKLVEKRRQYEKQTLALFKEANGLYKDGKFQDALAKLQQARQRTSCQRFRDSLGDKIKIVEARLKPDEAEAGTGRAAGAGADGGSSGQAVQNRPPAQAVETGCASFASQLRELSDEIKRRYDDYTKLKKDLARERRSRNIPASRRVEEARKQLNRIGPVACRVVEAKKQFQQIRLKAKNSGCTQAALIRDPLSAVDSGLDCHKWERSQGQ